MMSGASASVPCLDYIPLLPCSSTLSNHPSYKCHLPHFTNPTLTVYYSVTSPPFRRRLLPVLCSAADAANEANSADEPHKPDRGFWGKWKIDKAEINSKMAKLGLAAVLAYGLFDGVTYTSFFVLAFLGYEKSTGKNPAANLQALLGIVILMWTGNNVTRPFRVAGAAALAPLIDKGLKKIQKYFNFPSPVYAFAMVVASVAASCLTVVGLLILSRWGK